MIETNKDLSYLLIQYHTLCHYCDSVFQATRHAYQSHIHCARGCAACCSLDTVIPLEAYVIASFLKNSSQSHRFSSGSQPEQQCVFLENETQACTIYEVRPIICRTHGLPMTYPDQPGIDICPLNFAGDQDVLSVEPCYVLDVETITTNLMRLNLAFCILSQQPEIAGERISLTSILSGK